MYVFCDLCTPTVCTKCLPTHTTLADDAIALSTAPYTICATASSDGVRAVQGIDLAIAAHLRPHLVNLQISFEIMFGPLNKLPLAVTPPIPCRRGLHVITARKAFFCRAFSGSQLLLIINEPSPRIVDRFAHRRSNTLLCNVPRQHIAAVHNIIASL
ncbi:hypothetical protein P153DRAFT_391233 [Dothidotthia symphoricarpi CBS 119687]|uniref:Uncharacterized protein n=1 Tax=Dothidotthia symphoricarpi CBS 119687 TaxID=1392245 RepID=A0A6A5ZY47_9PLEO|nr:uncharacterized protein P153DRAFT_391233 [Dothidotthia symphoricarpi CBS 119687]KAF2123803.1 hypothetical protein P153DRAFT_391233 [Dothidotthia symphoricarpi CBS 119687]